MHLRILLPILCLAAASPVHAESLYKCISASKEITYTNQPCNKLPGLKELKTIEADPGPPIDETPKTEKKSRAEKLDTRENKESKREHPSVKRVLKAERAEKNQCGKLSDQIGDVMDKMDAARRNGYTLKQEAAWNEKIRQLNAKKRRLGCF